MQNAKLINQEKDCTITHRMNFLIGHLKANLKMLEDGKYCIGIIRQNQAVVAALEKVNEMILKNHLDGCVTKVIREKDEKEKRRVFQEIVEVFNEK